MPTFSPLAVILIGLTSARPMPIAVLRQAPTAKNDRPRPADGGKNEINSDPGGGSLLEREIDHFSSVAISRFKADPKWITVRHPARCAEPNCQIQINPGERGFYYPGDKSLYGSRCGHGEKAERDFAAHRIDEDSY